MPKKAPKPPKMYDLHQIEWPVYFKDGVKKYSVNPKWVATLVYNQPYAVIRSKLRFLAADRKCPDGTKFIPLLNGTNVYEWLRNHGNQQVSATKTPGLGVSDHLPNVGVVMAHEASSPLF